MCGEDGVGVALVFGVGGVGEELRHSGVVEGEDVVLLIGRCVGASRVCAEAVAAARHAMRWFRQLRRAWKCGSEVSASVLAIEAQSHCGIVEWEVSRASWSFKYRNIAGYVGFAMDEMGS